MATINKTPNRFEVTAVYRHPQAKADIVLVHGLNGAPAKTWLAPNGVYWPTDLLPPALHDQHANILVYGYNADVYSGFWERQSKSPSDNFIHHHAQTLVSTLTAFRKSQGTERLPIIWVVHSLGGILTKRALLYSNDLRDANQEDLRSIYVSTYGIIFLGTPHGGADLATWGTIIQRMADAVVPKKLISTEPVLLKTLKKDSETLQQITNHFLDIYQRFKIHMVHENHKTSVKGMAQFLVVDAVSASPQLPGVTYYGIEATHSGMCKFESESAPGWLTVSTAIREWIADAPNVIPIRWEVEEDQRRVRANLENFERARLYNPGQALGGQNNPPLSSSPPAALPGASGSVSTPALPLPPSTDTPKALPPASEPKALPPAPDPPPQPDHPDHEPLFIHPDKFRPNSYFIGREDELRGLHEMLMDRKRRSEGTSAVLIQCLPGGGKTHLARQYVFQHKDDYPGGVYWVRAKSRHELEYWFWRIARNEALRGLVDQRDVEELRDPRKIVHLVRRWLNSQSEWLVVFDGIQFDIPGLHEFIPDARNTSMIYTSTERAVTGDPRFNNPQVMELGLLTQQEATDLLLLEMERKKPWSADDQEKAAELVGLMGRLPLMIHVAAQHLKATREPLARYVRSYRDRPTAGDLPAYKAVREQLENRGETAALNLMSLLVFFDQHVPVEMLALGLSALDKSTPVKTRDAAHHTANLNNTLKVLIAFALVERSEGDGDVSPTSSRSSRRSFDRHVDYLDLLRVHSVVQAFFIDSLQEKRQLGFWLERAVAVWARSYDEADRRIREDSRVGLPEDYRRFSIHGAKLQQHLNRFQRRYPKLSGAREHLNARLSGIDDRITELSQAVQKNIVDGSAEEHPASVFDRLSTSSPSDAATIQSHESSQLSRTGSLRDPRSIDNIQSPTHVDLPGRQSLEWPPYPESTAMPPTPGILDTYDATSAISGGVDDDDQNTLVLSMHGTQLHLSDAASIVTASPDPSGGGRPGSSGCQSYFEDWHTTRPTHRVIVRQQSRRYHDRAGAWRDREIADPRAYRSDPRVGLSQAVAVGSIGGTGRGASTSNNGKRAMTLMSLPPITAQSEAAAQLHKIKLAAPPSPLGEVGGEGRPSSSGARPMTLVGRNSWAVAQTVKTPTTDVSAQILSSPKSWTEKTIRMLKTILPSSDKKNSEDANKTAPPRRPQSQGQLSTHSTVPSIPAMTQDGPADFIATPSRPPFRGSRSASSSPANRASPFPPPSFSAIPTDDLILPATQPVGTNGGPVPVIVHRYDTLYYNPNDGTYTPAPGAGGPAHYPYAADDGMSLSYPSLLPSAQQHQPLSPGHPQLQFLRGGPPAGYSSQPMSRDNSHRGSSSGGSNSNSLGVTPPGQTIATTIATYPHFNPSHPSYQHQHLSPQQQLPKVHHSPPSRSSSPARTPSHNHHHHPDLAVTGSGTVTPGGASSTTLPISTPSLPIRFTSSSTTLPGPAPGVGHGGGGPGLPLSFTRAHPPSYTETEPSPRLDNAFPDVDTSYNRWEQQHRRYQHQRGYGSWGYPQQQLPQQQQGVGHGGHGGHGHSRAQQQQPVGFGHGYGYAYPSPTSQAGEHQHGHGQGHDGGGRPASTGIGLGLGVDLFEANDDELAGIDGISGVGGGGVLPTTVIVPPDDSNLIAAAEPTLVGVGGEGGEAMARSSSAPGRTTTTTTTNAAQPTVAAGIMMDDGTVVGFGFDTHAPTTPTALATPATLATPPIGGSGTATGASPPRGGVRRGRAGSFPGTTRSWRG